MNQKRNQDNTHKKRGPGRPRKLPLVSGPPGWFTNRFTHKNQESGRGRLDRLLDAIDDVNTCANQSVLFPALANHLLTPIEKKDDIVTILPADLAQLPEAAADANFNQNFNMLEQFAILRFRLQPIFLGIDQRIEQLADGGKSIALPTITARSPGGRLVGEKLDISQQINAAVTTLMKMSHEHAKTMKVYQQGNWKHLQLSPPVRLLAATTWECWERATLMVAIKTLDLERDCVSRQSIELGAEFTEDVSLGSMEHLRRCMSLEGRTEEINYYRWMLKELEESGLEMVLVPTLEGICFACSPQALDIFYKLLSGKLCGGNRIEEAESSPLGGRGLSPSPFLALRSNPRTGPIASQSTASPLLANKALQETAVQELKAQSEDSPVPESWRPASPGWAAARAWMLTGQSLAYIWGCTLDLSVLRSIDTSRMSAKTALNIFIRATDTQQTMFNKRFRNTLQKFWAGAVRKRSFPEGFMEILVSYIEGFDNCQDGREEWCMIKPEAKAHQLDLQLIRLDIPTPSVRGWERSTSELEAKLNEALRQPLSMDNLLTTPGARNFAQPGVTSRPLLENSISPFFDKGAQNLIKMIKGLETFWIDEEGQVTPLLASNDPKPKIADGRWKKKFKRYVGQVSAKAVRDALKLFAKQAVMFRPASSLKQVG